MKSVYIISLGCDKNRVDTENLLYILRNAGFSITSEIDEAQVIIINTCAFLNSAREEAIDVILECAEYKKKSLEKLIVTGCLPEKYMDEIKDELKEVDAFMGIDSYQSVAEVVARLYDGERVFTRERCALKNIEGRLLTTPIHYAYLKIADGCNNFCSYCLIPSIRGRYRSRELDSLVSESRFLAGRGVKELILVAQDVTRYGYDIYKEYKLCELIERLSEIDGIEWIRLMYCYPEMVTKELITLIGRNKKVCKYIDIPLQHVSDGILKAMNRRGTYGSVTKLIKDIRNVDDRIALRSTFITGFPGETDKEFSELCEFLKEYKLTHAGFFAYSREEDTKSYDMPNQISDVERLARVEILHNIQQEVSLDNNRALIGKKLRVIYEDIDYGCQMFLGRSEFSAPDIDGKIKFKAKSVEIGNFYDIIVTDCDPYDLIGKIQNVR